MTDTLADHSVPGSTTADSLVVRVANKLASVRGVEPVDLPPLYEYVDVDALGALFPASANGPSRHGTVTFHVEDHQVRITNDGSVDVRSPDDPAFHIDGPTSS